MMPRRPHEREDGTLAGRGVAVEVAGGACGEKQAIGCAAE